jgi:hypothetical protein
VAIRDGQDLFLWIRIRRSKKGEVFCMLSTGSEVDLKGLKSYRSRQLSIRQGFLTAPAECEL